MTQGEIAKANRERVQEAAREVFQRLGAAVTMDDVAKQAGVSKGTVYKSYPTRDALLEAMVVWHYNRTVAQIERAQQSGYSARETLLRVMIDPELSAAAASLVMVHSTPPGAMTDSLHRALTKLDQVIAAGKEEGLLASDVDSDLLARMTIAVYRALPDDAGREALLRRMVDVVLRGLGPVNDEAHEVLGGPRIASESHAS